jgi:hypothetical protein
MWFISSKIDNKERKIVIIIEGDYPVSRRVYEKRKFEFLCWFRDENLVTFNVFVNY